MLFANKKLVLRTFCNNIDISGVNEFVRIPFNFKIMRSKICAKY